MNRRLLVSTCGMLLLAIRLAAQDDTEYYKTPSYRLTPVVRVVVTVPSNDDKYNPAETCDTFVMTSKRVKEFFLYSRVTSHAYYFHDSDLSSCSGEGTVDFANGDHAHWVLARNGVGIMSVLNGKRKGEVVYLHCRRCENWNF